MGKNFKPYDIIHYIVGHIRYLIYYSKFKFLLRKHIVEQIEFRIDRMDRTCWEQGQCKECGCATTQLQMCNKACDGNCYPKMKSKSKWLKYKKEQL